MSYCETPVFCIETRDHCAEDGSDMSFDDDHPTDDVGPITVYPSIAGSIGNLSLFEPQMDKLLPSSEQGFFALELIHHCCGTPFL